MAYLLPSLRYQSSFIGMSNHFSNLKARVIQDPKPNAWRVQKQYMNNTLTCQTAFLVRAKPQQN